jgi:exopolysaccharide biosynthesis polyprenyl glycosylphosphotransferase
MTPPEPVETGRAETLMAASGAGGNAGAMTAESAPSCAAVELVRPPEPAAAPLRAGGAGEPARLLATDGTAVFGSAAALASRGSGLMLAALMLAALSVTVLAVLGLYRRKLILSVLDDAFRVVAGIGMAWAATKRVAAPLAVTRGLPAGWLWWLAVAGCVLLARAGTYAVLRRGRVRRPQDAVLVGSSPVLTYLAGRLSQRPELGLRPVGFVGPPRPVPETGLPLPVLAPVDALDGVLAETRAQHVIVGFGAAPDSDLVEPLRRLRQQGRTVFLVPRLFELNVACPDAEAVDGIPLVRLPPMPDRRWSWLAKRPLDVVGAMVALVLAAPLFLACAVAVRRETGRDGVLFRQQRVGQHGRPFPILKFRSLTPGSAAESQHRWNIAGDAQVGPVGRLLRRTCLDELPQLVNVLRGDMSLVGPRPERPFFVAQFGRRYRRYLDRLRVPPGITGWAQVHGLRGDTSIEDRAALDNYYIENWSLGLDVKIMLRTVGFLLRSGRRGTG